VQKRPIEETQILRVEQDLSEVDKKEEEKSRIKTWGV